MMVSENVRRFYDDYPFPGRLNAYGPWTERAPQLLASVGIAPEAARGARVLDAGCGTGEFARSFAHHGAVVTAVDLSAGALAAARRLDADLGLKGVDYRQGSLLDLGDIGKFDMVLSLGVLHHTEDPERGFRSLSRLVRPGGHLVVGLYSSVSRAHILLMRRLLQVVGRGNRERSIDFAMRSLIGVLPGFIGGADSVDRARVADLLVHPHEHPVSLHSALRWFRECGLAVTGGSPSHDATSYPVLSRVIPTPESAVRCFVIQLDWMRKAADYYVVAGRAPASGG